MGKNILLILLIISLLESGGCGKRVVDEQQVAKNEKIVIKFSHVVAEDSPKGLAAKRFADLVRERTGGYVEIQVFPNSTLYKDGEEIDALKHNDVQIIAPATSKLSEMFPEWQLLDLPYAFTDPEDVLAFMEGPIGKRLLSQLESQGFLGLAIWDNGFKQMTNDLHPLVKPSDFQGLRFRVMPSPTLENQFIILGASAIPMPFNDVLSALQTKGVDGEENTVSNIFTQRFDQAQKYLTLSNHGYLGYAVLVNQSFWQGLPPSIRKVLDDTMMEVTIWERQKAEEVNAMQISRLEKEGQIKITRLKPEEQEIWKIALSPVYDRLADRIGPNLVNLLRTP